MEILAVFRGGHKKRFLSLRLVSMKEVLLEKERKNPLSGNKAIDLRSVSVECLKCRFALV